MRAAARLRIFMQGPGGPWPRAVPRAADAGAGAAGAPENGNRRPGPNR